MIWNPSFFTEDFPALKISEVRPLSWLPYCHFRIQCGEGLRRKTHKASVRVIRPAQPFVCVPPWEFSGARDPDS